MNSERVSASSIAIGDQERPWRRIGGPKEDIKVCAREPKPATHSRGGTLLNEIGWHWPSHWEAIERQLAHGISNGARRVYNYGQHLPARGAMMISARP
jgi:hypothetical protein